MSPRSYLFGALNGGGERLDAAGRVGKLNQERVISKLEPRDGLRMLGITSS